MTEPLDAPEQAARRSIDAALAAAGWILQDRDQVNLGAGLGVAVASSRPTPAPGKRSTKAAKAIDGTGRSVAWLDSIGVTAATTHSEVGDARRPRRVIG